MGILRLRFQCLSVFLHRKLDTVCIIFYVMCFQGYLILFLWFVSLFTRFWWLSLILASWTYLDRKTCENGGRPIHWIKNLSVWKHLNNYFPTSLIRHPEFNLDPRKNYMFACFPHGLFPYGPGLNIVSNFSEFYQSYPQFSTKIAIVPQKYYVPVKKDFVMALGGISCSAKSIDFILRKPGSQILILWPGGGREIMQTEYGKYRFIVQNRKGFVKMAIKHGTALVPVITFGETELFEQFNGPFARKIQSWSKKWLGITPPIYKYFQVFGAIPKQRRLITVVGKPMNVTRVEEPSTEDIEDLHTKFVKELVTLFENYKVFIEDPKKRNLELL